MRARPPQERSSRLERGPLFRPLKVHDVPDTGLDLTIEAAPEELAAIAADADLPAVSRLSVTYAIAPRSGGRVHVSGDLTATITQICGVSLDPFDSDVTQLIDLIFAPEAPTLVEATGRRHPARDFATRSPPASPRVAPVPGNDDQHDPPDPIIDGTIDLGAVAMEFLNLARDPYPRKPDVHFTDVVIGEKDDAEPSAFAALKRLKDPS